MPTSSSTRRRRLLGGGVAATLLAGKAWAQAFPSRPIRLVVPFPAGGAPDIMARAIAPGMGADLGQPVVIDNKPGAAGGLGAESVAKSAADGHTLLLGSISTNAINASLYPNLPYDPRRDFAALSLVGSVPNVLVVTESLPVRTVAELVALAKARPGAINFGSSGSGSTLHMSGELFRLAAGIDLQHVPYKGSAPAVAELIAGQIQMMFDNAPSALPHVKAGRLRALAQTGAQRSPLLPEVPTMVEQGFAGFVVTGWGAVFAPAATPPAVLDRLHAALLKSLESGEVRQRLEPLGVDLQPQSREACAAFVAAETARWAEVVKQANIKAES
ncbi:MAG: tripartite tricarboxylate transporter substrate binding protein [Reyranellaceae bacterium]